jgi:hypothetical protein
LSIKHSQGKKQASAGAFMHDNGGISDNDEIRGEEWEVAINSPSKGKKQVTSEVSFFFELSFIQQSNCYPN